MVFGFLGSLPALAAAGHHWEAVRMPRCQDARMYFYQLYPTVKGQVVKGSMFIGGVGSTRSSAAKKSSAGETFASREFDVKLS